MTKKQPKGPSLSALAALTTLALALWMEVDLATALFRSVLVYLGMSILLMAYRVLLGRFVAAARDKAAREILEKAQMEAEEEHRRQMETALKQKESQQKEPKKEKAKAETTKQKVTQGEAVSEKDLRKEEAPAEV